MKQFMKKVSSLVLMIGLLFAFNLLNTTFVADAASSYQNLALNDTFVQGNIPEAKTTNYYTVQLSSAGWLTVTYQGWNIADSYYEIVNYDQTNSYYKKNVYTSSDTAPKTDSKTLALEAGTYIVKVYCYGDHYGDYRIKASFSAAGNNESEPNNYFSNAMTLSKDQLVTGFLSVDDTIDFYKVTLTEAATLRLTYTSRISDTYISLWDSNYVQVLNKNVYTGSEANPKTAVIDQACQAGTYYIKVTPYSGSQTGRYDLKWSTAPIQITNITITGDTTLTEGSSVQLSTMITPSNATNKTLTWTSNNPEVATVDSNGIVTGISEGVATITATATDDSGCSNSIVITVNAATVESASPSLKKVESVKANSKSGKKVKVSWDKQTNAKKYEIQISTNKKFKKNLVKKKVNSNKKNITIKYKKTGTAYVRVRAISSSGKVGSWSKTIKVKVK